MAVYVQPSRTKSNPNSQNQRSGGFATLMRALVALPKKKLDERLAQEKKARSRRKA